MGGEWAEEMEQKRKSTLRQEEEEAQAKSAQTDTAAVAKETPPKQLPALKRAPPSPGVGLSFRLQTRSGP